jgi:hypothetical protein
MTEFLNIERADGLRVATSMADRAIAQICDAYEGMLSNGELGSYRQLTDVSRKVDEACWGLANPDKFNMRNKAVSLRSWHIIRLVERQIENIPARQEWPYWFFLTGTDMWPKDVLATTDAYVPKFIATQYSADPRPQLTLNNPREGYQEQLLLSVHDRALLRRQWSYGDGTAYQVAYVVKGPEE